MFVIPTQKVGFTHRVVAMLAAFAIVLWSVGVYGVAQAANLANVSVLLTDSAPNVTSGHVITFDTPTAIVNGTVTVTFPSGFNLGSLVTGDVTTAQGTTSNISGQVVTFTSVNVATSGTMTINVAPGKVINPAVGSYEFEIETPTDSGKTRVAIVDSVLVTATVDTIFNFVVAGLADTTAITATTSTTTTGSSTASTLDFGTVTPGGVYVLGQELTVETNAIHGFVVTIEKDTELQSANGAIIDTFKDGSNATTADAWATPSKDIDLPNTWGHWGMTSNDGDLAFGGDWVAVPTAPVVIFSHDGPADALTQDKGKAQVAYGLEITSFQEAADDYTTTLTYIATPTF